MIILGAGMSGCLAAILNGGATVFEASPEPPLNHKAVLRFRSDKISKATGIPFKRVEVHKAIYHNEQLYRVCTPFLANTYSKKVAGRILPRSIWNLESDYRYVAPSNFHEHMLTMIGEQRVKYGMKAVSICRTSMAFECGLALPREGVPVISTLPMPVMAELAGFSLDKGLFSMKPITTARATVEACDVNQTVYYPGIDTKMYRATLTGAELIMEFIGGEVGAFDVEDSIQRLIIPAFGLNYGDISEYTFGTQQYGKIAPVDSNVRKAFMFELTQHANVYSLGRFAAWRNILLDDVYEDIFAIRRMIEQSNYDIVKGMCA